MKKKFSKHWKASKQPRKQRKYLANAPLHIKRKFLSVNLVKTLREKHKTRNVPVRKGDKVKVMRGSYKGKSGKVVEVKIKLGKIYMENVQRKKLDGSSVNVPIKASNLQILELNTEDKKRKLGKREEVKKETQKELNKEIKKK